MTNLEPASEEHLYQRVVAILEDARARVNRLPCLRAAREEPRQGAGARPGPRRAKGEITLPEENEQILAARYQMYLPTEEELRTELSREREEVERRLRLVAATSDDELLTSARFADTWK